jgi:hypothetical protein
MQDPSISAMRSGSPIAGRCVVGAAGLPARCGCWYTRGATPLADLDAIHSRASRSACSVATHMASWRERYTAAWSYSRWLAGPGARACACAWAWPRGDTRRGKAAAGKAASSRAGRRALWQRGPGAAAASPQPAEEWDGRGADAERGSLRPPAGAGAAAAAPVRRGLVVSSGDWMRTMSW